MKYYHIVWKNPLFHSGFVMVGHTAFIIDITDTCGGENEQIQTISFQYTGTSPRTIRVQGVSLVNDGILSGQHR
jgi:hypothetical protein